MNLDCKDTNWAHVWVDGGGNCGPGSLGVVVVIKGMVEMTYGQYLGDHSTNNIAELNAIWKGLRLVKHLKIPVKIYGDSNYALRSVTKSWNGRKNRDLVDEITAYIADYPWKIEFVKVRGHSGLPYNEYADSIASWFLAEEKKNGNHKPRRKRKAKSSATEGRLRAGR